MAALAALALGVTVRVAQHALDNAGDVVIRGDADTLIAGLVVELADAEWPVTSETLTQLLARHQAQRLRYVALVDRQSHQARVAAGAALITKPFDLPGEVAQQGRRFRRIDALARLYARTEGRRDITGLTRLPLDTSAAVSARETENAPEPRVYLVVEFEPPVIERLENDLRLIWIVAALAALVLVAFAFAWRRATERLSAVQSAAEADRRLVALGRASSVIAHELRNPLSALKGHAQLLVEDLAEPSRTKAERVVEGAERLERLTSVLLDFVRESPLDIRPLAPAELIDRALAELPRERVHVDLAGAPEVLNVDAERMSLAVRNLLQNAVQASPDETCAVEVRFDGRGREVVIEVRDHGTGIAPGAKGQIFEPFVTTRARGTGLGLAIARRIVEQHHGTVTGETHADGGAVFRLVLPVDLATAIVT
jgi:two-component system, NtrC family, sensor histidine kinase HydH